MTTRRQVMKLAAFAASQAALLGAARAEGNALPGTTGTPAVAPAPLPFAQQTPMRVGAAALRVRDLGRMRSYYTELLKFDTLRADSSEVVLGVDNAAVLHLIHRPDAVLEKPTAAGLFHTAFLMPSRADFARWLVHAALARTPFDGFADHHVSEASYLTDPEGNGIEVYSDRPQSTWTWTGNTVGMGTDQLDIDNIVAQTDTARDQYVTAPKALRIGHVHLRVGDVARGRDFYQGLIGMEPTRERAGAAFLSSGRYHHHIAVNTWQSAGAAARNAQETGLAWFSLQIADDKVMADRKRRVLESGLPSEALAEGLMIADPWGTQVRLVKV